MPVEQAFDKQPIEPGRVYVAPPGYHLLVDGGHFALSVDEPVEGAVRVPVAGEGRARCDQSQGSGAGADGRADLLGHDERRHQQHEPPEDDAQRGWVDECYEAPADQGTDRGRGGDESGEPPIDLLAGEMPC